MTDPSLYSSLDVILEYDDGAVVYLNGVELFRANLPTGTIAYSTLASTSLEDTMIVYPINPSALVTGTNVLAVEVHQESATSNDCHFELRMMANQIAGQSVWRKYYYAGGARVAMREGITSTGTTGLSFLLGDHLGSTNVTTNATGQKVSELRHKPWGEVRYSLGTSQTTFRFTGQREEAALDMYYYGARWYNPYLNHFTQPDTIIPDPSNPLAWNRYAYGINNPLKYTDPSGHYYCEGSSECKFNNYHRLSGKQILTEAISEKFGIELVDGEMNWNSTNLRTAYNALNEMNYKLNGNLKSMVRGTTFTMASQSKCGEGDCYHGITTSTGVTFYISAFYVSIPIINFFHETAHLLDYVPGTKDVFSDPLNPLKGGVTPTWIDEDGYVDIELLIDRSGDPIQAKPMNESYEPNEYWADAFGNYMAGNIDLSTTEGWNMYHYVQNALNPYANP